MIKSSEGAAYPPPCLPGTSSSPQSVIKRGKNGAAEKMTIIKRTGHIRMRCKMSLQRGSPDRIAVSPLLRLGQRPPLPLQQEQPLVILPLDLCAAFAQILYLNVAFKLSTESSGGRRGAGGGRLSVQFSLSVCSTICRLVGRVLCFSALASFLLCAFLKSLKYFAAWFSCISRTSHATRNQRGAGTDTVAARPKGGRQRGKGNMDNVNASYLRVRSWHIFICSASNGGPSLAPFSVPAPLQLGSLSPSTMWSLPAALTLCHHFCSIFTAKVAKTGGPSK